MIPLRWKLVLLQGALFAVVVAGTCAALVVGLRRSLVDELDAELASRARSVCALVENEGGEWSVEPDSGLEEEYAEGRGVYYVIADPRGEVLLRSPLARRWEVRPPVEEGGRDREVGRQAFREVTVRLTKHADEEGRGAADVRVACGRLSSSVELAVDALVRQAALIAPLALGLSLLLGMVLVRRALRPLDRIAGAAERISAADLSQRVPVEGRDEVARLARVLNDAFERLEASFGQQRRFTADASHELRTPLAVISAASELALKRPRSPEEYRVALEGVREAAQGMRGIVEALMTLAAADAGTAAMRREPVALPRVVEDVVNALGPLAKARDVRIETSLDGAHTVPGDAERLRQLVSNLVSNAIRYNRPGGSVTVTIARIGDRVELRVEDCGIGISEEDLPHVFERFWRADKARTRDEGGAGLGLSIAKWIAEAHGGTITASSQLGRGSRFVVSLPIDRPDPPEALLPAAL